jgi:hypothetical protein
MREGSLFRVMLNLKKKVQVMKLITRNPMLKTIIHIK